jgi:23S rRNA pseudouridine1911/1915/1917 synthase
MVVHPAAGNYHGTLVNALLMHCQDLSGINGVARPGIVHRLDKDTSGVMVVAKTDQAHVSLAQQIKERSASRRYLAIVHGNIKEDTGVIDAPIGRHPIDRKRMAVVFTHSKPAVTKFGVLERFGNYTLVQCKLQTGRTHQIRVHMAYIGHPVVGDPKYGPARREFAIAGQALHSAELTFTHPATGQVMHFTAPLPMDMQQILASLRKNTGR